MITGRPALILLALVMAMAMCADSIANAIFPEPEVHHVQFRR